MDKFGKIRRHQWKDLVQVSKLPSLKLMITKEDLAPKIANFTGVCMVGWGAQTCPHHKKIGKIFASDVSLILRRSLQWC